MGRLQKMQKGGFGYTNQGLSVALCVIYFIFASLIQYILWQNYDKSLEESSIENFNAYQGSASDFDK